VKFFGISVTHFLQKKEGDKLGGMIVSKNGDIVLSIYKKNTVVMYKNFNIHLLGDTQEKMSFDNYKINNVLLDGKIMLKLWIP